MFDWKSHTRANAEAPIAGHKPKTSKVAASGLPFWTRSWNSLPADGLVDASLQAKLTVSEAGDLYEQEADQVAEQVMRMPNPASLPLRQPEAARGAPPATHEGAGQPLDPDTRQDMELRFAHDFGDVRIQRDGSAAASAESVNARAFTVGRNIVFGAGQYNPHTGPGRQLLAHELTHVVQQGVAGAAPSRGYAARTGAQPAISISGPRLAREVVTASNMRIREDILKEITRNSKQKDDPEWVKLGKLFEDVPDFAGGGFPPHAHASRHQSRQKR